MSSYTQFLCLFHQAFFTTSPTETEMQKKRATSCSKSILIWNQNQLAREKKGEKLISRERRRADADAEGRERKKKKELQRIEFRS